MSAMAMAFPVDANDDESDDPSAFKNWDDVPPLLTKDEAVTVAKFVPFLLLSITVVPEILIAIFVNTRLTIIYMNKILLISFF